MYTLHVFSLQQQPLYLVVQCLHLEECATAQMHCTRAWNVTSHWESNWGTTGSSVNWFADAMLLLTVQVDHDCRWCACSRENEERGDENVKNCDRPAKQSCDGCESWSRRVTILLIEEITPVWADSVLKTDMPRPVSRSAWSEIDTYEIDSWPERAIPSGHTCTTFSFMFNGPFTLHLVMRWSNWTVWYTISRKNLQISFSMGRYFA